MVLTLAGLVGCGGTSAEPASSTTESETTTTIDADVQEALDLLDETQLEVEEMIRQLQYGSWREAQLANDRAGASCDRTVAALEKVLTEDEVAPIQIECLQIRLGGMASVDEDQQALWARARDVPDMFQESADRVRQILDD